MQVHPIYRSLRPTYPRNVAHLEQTDHDLDHLLVAPRLPL